MCMINTRKTSKNGKTCFIKIQLVKFELLNIITQDFPVFRVKRAAFLSRCCRWIILKMRIAQGTTWIHDARRCVPTNIQFFGMIQADHVPILMRSGSGCLQEIGQFEITGVAANTIKK